MDLTLMDNRKTIIKVTKKQFPYYEKIIKSYIILYGGKLEKENSRYIYYIINADLLNKKR